MTKLTDIQAILLTLGAQREDGSLLPPPDTLQNKPSPVRKAIAQLIKRSLAAEVAVTDATTVWREDGEQRFGAIITDVGKLALSETDAAVGQGAATEPSPAPSPRADTKQSKVLELLKRDKGASLDELVQATGWLPHTTRAALTGIRKRGITLDKSKVDGVTRYRAVGAAA